MAIGLDVLGAGVVAGGVAGGVVMAARPRGGRGTPGGPARDARSPGAGDTAARVASEATGRPARTTRGVDSNGSAAGGARRSGPMAEPAAELAHAGGDGSGRSAGGPARTADASGAPHSDGAGSRTSVAA